MTAAATAPRTVTERMLSDDQAQSILDELIARGIHDRTTPPPDALHQLTVRSAQEAVDAIALLQDASLKLTHPEDWVLFDAKDGAKVCFLQDVGCQRIRPLWGISFDSTSLRRDVVDRMLEDGSFFVEAIVRARSRFSDETIEELGCRSSLGFFSSAWESANKKSLADIEKVKSDIRKAAIANGRGRCIRTITGTAQVPIGKLQAAGLDIARVRGVRFEQGTRGGSGNYASEPQIKKLAFEAKSKVVGLDKAVGDYEAIFKLLLAAAQGGKITKARATQLIDGFTAMNDESKPIDVATFEKMIGVDLVEKGGE